MKDADKQIKEAQLKHTEAQLVKMQANLQATIASVENYRGVVAYLIGEKKRLTEPPKEE